MKNFSHSSPIFVSHICLVAELKEHIGSCAPEGKAVIDEVDNIRAKGNPVGQKEKISREGFEGPVKPVIKRKDEKNDIQHVNIQQSCQVEDQTALKEKQERRDVNFRKKGSVEEIESDPADGKKPHHHAELE
jgi:hypothetical protein